MARQTLTKTVALGGYPASLVGTTLTFTAADATNKQQFVSTGKELVIAKNSNSGSTARTVTINSTADERNRTADYTAVSIAAGATAIFGPFPQLGWVQPDGKIYLEASHAEILWAVVQLP